MSMTNYAQFNARSNKKSIPKNSESLTRFSHGPTPTDPFITPPISQGTAANNNSQMSQNQGPLLYMVNGQNALTSHRNGFGALDHPQDQIMKSIMNKQSHGSNGPKVSDMQIDKMIQDRIQ